MEPVCSLRRHRQLWLLLCFLFVGLFVFAGHGTATAEENALPPNVLLFLVDDLGWADLGCYGSEFHETPNIDALARSGMRFTNAYAACPVCSPTRASIQTGRHPVRVGITDWIPGQNVEAKASSRFLHVEDRDHLALDEITIAEVLKSAGYQTFHLGKWHLGGEGSLPTDHGYEVNIGGFHVGSPPGGYYSPFKNPHLNERNEEEYLTTRLTEEAIALLRQRDPRRPFFMNFCYYNVHTPIQPYRERIDHFRTKAQKFTGPTPSETEHEGSTRLRQDNPEYASMVAAVDDSIGAMMAALEQLGLSDNTIVLFFSDNGGLSTLKGVGPTANGSLRAGKGWLYEGGIREPLIVRAPGITPAASVSDEVVFSCDFFPTLLQLADVAVPADLTLDGVALTDVLYGEPLRVERPLYWHYPHYHGSTWTPGAAIRVGDWKLIEFYHWDEVELYNLAADPGERHNLAAEKPELVKQIRGQLRAWQEELGAQMPVPRGGD